MMESMEVRNTRGDEWCSFCHKQGEKHTTVIVGPLHIPFCDECWAQFRKLVIEGTGKKEFGV